MKKLFFLIILVIGIGLVSRHWEQVKFWIEKQPQLSEVLKKAPVLAEIKEQVLTGGALRGQEDYANARLTTGGVIAFTNSVRTKNGGLPSLSGNQKLAAAAGQKIQNMFDKQYFEHVSPDGKGPGDLAKAAGYEYVMVGENLAMGNFKNDESLVTAWMNSPGHRANILNNRYMEIGVAVAQGKFQGRTVWLAVQEFGKPISSCPVVDINLKARIESAKKELNQIETQLKVIKTEMETASNPQTEAETNAYNEQVKSYNALVKIYNNKLDITKQISAEYNSQVEKFNQCAT